MRERYEKSNKFARIIKFPFIFWKAYCKGYNSEDDRKICHKGLLKNTALLCVSVFAFVFVVFLAILTAISIRDRNYIAEQAKEANRILAKFASPEEPGFIIEQDRIEKFKRDMVDYPHDLAFFSGYEDTIDLIQKVEEEYNRRVYKLASEYCSFEENCDQEPSKMISAERQERCKKRIKRWNNAKEKLTNLPTKIENDNKREIADVIDEAIGNENRKLENIIHESDLNDNLYELANQIKDEDVCREIEKILDKYEGSFLHRKGEFERLHKQLAEKEKTYENRLLSMLEKYKDKLESTDCDDRIRLATTRIEIIESFSKYYSCRSQYIERHNALIADARRLIEDCKHDNPLYVALKKLRGIPEKGKIRIIDDFLQNFSSEDYPRCIKYIDVLKDERASLIKQKNDRIATAWEENPITNEMSAKVKIERLTAIKTILEEALAEYTIGSEEYKNAERQIADITTQLSREDKNIVFESAYIKLMNSSDEGKLRRIEDFLTPEKFTIESYPNKKVSFEKLEEERKRLCEKWNEYRITVEKDNSDNIDLSAAERSKLLDKLIQVYEKLKNEYCESSSEYKQIVTILEKTREKQAPLTVYIAFDKDYQEIEKRDKYSKPKALDNLIQKYSMLDIKEEKYREFLRKSKEQYQDLVISIKKELSNEIARIFKDSEGASWQKQCISYKQAIDIVNKFKAYFPAKECDFFDTKVTEMKIAMTDLEHYGNLSDAFMELPKDSEPIILLNAIVLFSKKYKQSDYPEKTEIFKQLTHLQLNTEKTLRSVINDSIEKIVKPDVSDFSKCITYYTECKKIIDEVLEKLDIQTGEIYSFVLKKHNEYSHKIESNTRFATVYNNGQPLTSDDGQSDAPVAKLRLSSIKAFKERYPRAQNPEIELKPLYDQIDDIQIGIESYLANYIDEELDKIKEELPPAATNMQRVENLKKQRDFLEDYTVNMLTDSHFYTIYNGRLIEICKILGETENEAHFYKKFEELQEYLDSNIAVAEKIKLINDFLGRCGEYEKFSEKSKELTNRLEQYNNETEWENLVSEIKQTIKKRPAEDAQNFILSEYKAKINNYLEKVNKYSKINYLLSSTNEIFKMLNDQINYVETSIGDGSYNDILKKEKNYKANSSYAQLKSLRNSIISFDNHKYPQYTERVDSIEKQLNKDNDLYNNIKDKFDNFIKSPDRGSFESFQSAIKSYLNWNMEYNSNHTDLNKYIEYYNTVNPEKVNGLTYQLDLLGVFFSEKWDDIKFSIISSGPQNNNTYSYVISKGTSKDYSTSKEFISVNNLRPTQDNVINEIFVPKGTTIRFKITFDNWKAYPVIFTERLDYWQLLSKSVNGSFTHCFEGCNTEGKKGFIQIKIFGGPQIK